MRSEEIYWYNNPVKIFMYPASNRCLLQVIYTLQISEHCSISEFLSSIICCIDFFQANDILLVWIVLLVILITCEFFKYTTGPSVGPSDWWCENSLVDVSSVINTAIAFTIVYNIGADMHLWVKQESLHLPMSSMETELLYLWQAAGPSQTTQEPSRNKKHDDDL